MMVYVSIKPVLVGWDRRRGVGKAMTWQTQEDGERAVWYPWLLLSLCSGSAGF